MEQVTNPSRRSWLASLAMGIGLLSSYGVFAVQGLLFLLPQRLKAPTRRLFAGQIDQFQIGALQGVLDLQGNEILVKRDQQGLRAFNSTCPHLGCRVHWEADRQRFDVLNHSSPPVFFLPRVFFDETHGDMLGTDFHPTRVVLDLTVSPVELDADSGVLPLNAVGLPASHLGSSQANVELRIPTQEDFGSSQFSVLRNLRGRPLAPEQSFPVLLDYWRSQNQKRRMIWPGLGTYRMAGKEKDYSPTELRDVITLLASSRRTISTPSSRMTPTPMVAIWRPI